MKIARVLLLAALLLSAFSSTAFTLDRAAGFIRLVAQPDPSIPMPLQSQEALHRLMPKLLAAKSSGQIISFERSLNGGVLQIIYRPSAGIPDLGGQMVYSKVQDALPNASTASLVCTTPAFQIFVYESTFYSGCLTPAARVVGTLRDPSGRAVSSYSGTVGSTGSLGYAIFSTWNGWISNALPGYTVTFKEYAGTTLLATFKVKVPAIKFSSINKISSIVQGTGPAGKSVTLRWIHDLWDAGHTFVDATKQRTISSSGVWKVDFGTIPLHGSDLLFADVHQNATFTFSVTMTIPATYCMLGSYFCELYGFAFTPAILQIIHGGKTYTFTGEFDKSGYFPVEFRTAAGVPIFLAPYDKISGTGIAQFSLPKLTAVINYTANTVSGKAPPNRYIYSWVFEPNAFSWFSIYTHANSSGVYTADFGTAYGEDLLPTDPYTLEVYLVLPTTGNATDYFEAIVP